MTGLIRRYSQIAAMLALLCALALVLTGFSGSPQSLEATFSGPTNVSASAADGTITVTWTPGNAAASQVIVVVNVVDDTDFCLWTDHYGSASSYQCDNVTEGETYVALVIALDGDGGYELDMTTVTIPLASIVPSGEPDLVVSTPTLDGDDPTLGATFTLQTAVTNRGSASAGATTLRYYRSSEPAVSSADTYAGGELVTALAAAGSSDHSTGLTAPSEPGIYYYRACVDRVSGESNTTNNCSGVLALTVVAPDLAVSTPTVDGDNPLLGTTFTMAVTVTNQGSTSAPATTLRYYSSAADTITTDDTELGTDSVGTLAAYGTSDQSIDLDAPTADGTYYYGACVDAVSGESDTANNCSGALVMTLGAPDLLVSTPTASVDNPTSGASFTLSATVRNQGSSGAGASTLRYYRSNDVTITTSDTELGTGSVTALDAFGSSDQSIDLTAPSQMGTYYYGACVDTVTGESSTTNNCSAALAVTVVAPDLLVNRPTLEGDNPAVGASFTLEARVLNQGGDESGATTLRYYRSDDATITTSDTEVGTSSVSNVVAAGISNQSVALTAPADAGGYYYGACVDAVSGESDNTNNCSSALTVTVEAPDLAVNTPALVGGNPTVGASFTLRATVSNRSGVESAATTLHYYRSEDTTITTSDTELGTDSVDALSGHQTKSHSIDLTAPSRTGTYYYGACVDTVSGESDNTNNCSSVLAVSVVAPDLAVNTPRVDGDTPLLGATFTLEATVKNQGSGESAATTLRYYRSNDTTITTSDTSLGIDSVGSLAANAASDQSIDLTAPSAAGTYYYGVCVDAVSDESDTTNNCSAALVLVLGAADLVVNAASVSASNPAAGASFTLSATVRNQGGAEAAATTLRYYSSTDSTITTSDTSAGTDSVSVLVANSTSDQSIDLTAPSDDGIYYYGACVDTVSEEADTTNNCSSAVTITVGTSTAPDLLVKTPVVNYNVVPAEGSFTLTTEVYNQGDKSSLFTTLRYYRSTDATISSADTSVGTDSVHSLNPSLSWKEPSTRESIDLTAPADVGTYYYGACVDAVDGESDTTNNCSSGVAVTVDPNASADPPANNPATGSVTISGTLRVGETVTVVTSGISDADGMVYAEYSYTWTAYDSETESNYLQAMGFPNTFEIPPRVAGLVLHVTAAFADDKGNRESRKGEATAAVAATVPDPPTDLEAASDNAGELALTWEEPVTSLSVFLTIGAVGNGGSPITGYKVQWKESTDSWDTAADVSETIVTGESHTITGLTSGTSYTVRAFSRNAVGFGAASDEVTGTLE